MERRGRRTYTSLPERELSIKKPKLQVFGSFGKAARNPWGHFASPVLLTTMWGRLDWSLKFGNPILVGFPLLFYFFPLPL